MLNKNIAALVAALGDDDPQVRDAARRQLERLFPVSRPNGPQLVTAHEARTSYMYQVRFMFTPNWEDMTPEQKVQATRLMAVQLRTLADRLDEQALDLVDEAVA